MTRLWIFFKLIDYVCCCWKLWNNSGERCCNTYVKCIQMSVSASSPAEAAQANVDQHPVSIPRLSLASSGWKRPKSAPPHAELLQCQAPSTLQLSPAGLIPCTETRQTLHYFSEQAFWDLFSLFLKTECKPQITLLFLTAWSSLEKNTILALNYVVSSSNFESVNTLYSNAKDFIKFLYLLYNHQKKTVEGLRSNGGISPTALPAREHALPFDLNGQQNATERRHAPSDNSIGDVQLSIDYWEAAPSIGHKTE